AVRGEILADLGETESAGSELAAALQIATAFSATGEPDAATLVVQGIAPLIASISGDMQIVRPAYEALLAEDNALPGGVCPLGRARGCLALRLDLLDEAERHFRTGLEWCERERCPVEAGRCHQGLAEVAEHRGDHALAMQHL